MNIRRSVVNAELWRLDAARLEKIPIFAFFGKSDPLQENFQNSVLKVFIATPIDVLCSNFAKFSRREIGEIVRYLPDKKNTNSPGSPALATVQIAPKSARASPRQRTQSAQDFIQLGSLSAELYPKA